MEIDKDRIQKIISQMEASEAPFYEACQMLKELIEPKWEPKPDNEYSKEAQDLMFIMNNRNCDILKYKLEKGYGDGAYIITNDGHGEWGTYFGITSNPELTFETREQANEVIRMVGLND